MRTTSLALLASCASALQIPLQKHLDLHSTDGKPFVETEALQALVSVDKLKKRAQQLYEIAKQGEEEYGHPTRVIGSKGNLLFLPQDRC